MCLVCTYQPAAHAAKPVRPPPSSLPHVTAMTMVIVFMAGECADLGIIGSTKKSSYVSNGAKPSTKAVLLASIVT